MDRLFGENEDLLQQLNSLTTDLKKTAKENSALHQEVGQLQAKCDKLQRTADKSMELEAALICLKERFFLDVFGKTVRLFYCRLKCKKICPKNI